MSPNVRTTCMVTRRSCPWSPPAIASCRALIQATSMLAWVFIAAAGFAAAPAADARGGWRRLLDFDFVQNDALLSSVGSSGGLLPGVGNAPPAPPSRGGGGAPSTTRGTIGSTPVTITRDTSVSSVTCSSRSSAGAAAVTPRHPCRRYPQGRVCAACSVFSK